MSYTLECPVCHVERPWDPHLDWCTYDGPEPEKEEEDSE